MGNPYFFRKTPAHLWAVPHSAPTAPLLINDNPVYVENIILIMFIILMFGYAHYLFKCYLFERKSVILFLKLAKRIDWIHSDFRSASINYNNRHQSTSKPEDLRDTVTLQKKKPFRN